MQRKPTPHLVFQSSRWEIKWAAFPARQLIFRPWNADSCQGPWTGRSKDHLFILSAQSPRSGLCDLYKNSSYLLCISSQGFPLTFAKHWILRKLFVHLFILFFEWRKWNPFLMRFELQSFNVDLATCAVRLYLSIVCFWAVPSHSDKYSLNPPTAMCAVFDRKVFSLRILAMFLWASSCTHLLVTEKQEVLIKINPTTLFSRKEVKTDPICMCVSVDQNHNVCARSGRLIEANERTLKRRNYLQAYWAPKKRDATQ